MEFDLLSLKMRSSPPTFRGLLSPLYPKSYTISRKKPNMDSKPLMFSLHRHSSSCASLKIVESHQSTDSALFEFKKAPLQLDDEEFSRGSNKSPNRTNSNSSSIVLEKNGRSRNIRNLNRSETGYVVGIERKRRLIWYSELLRNCALNGSLIAGKAIHGQLIRTAIDPDMHLWVSLINFYAKHRNLHNARKVLDEMPERDVVSWTALIAGFVAEGYSNDGVKLFREMRREDIRPNEFTFASALKACSLSLNLDFGKQIHAEVVKVGAFSDIYVGSSLVDLYAKCGEMEYANKVFFFMPEQNAISWNALLNGYAQKGDGDEVFRLFSRMKNSEMNFSKYTLSTVLKGVARSGSLRTGKVVHAMAIKLDCELDEYISCSLLDMYSKCGLANDALNIFARIKNPDIVTWSAIITCLDQQGQKQEAVELFCSMRRAGLRPNQFTLATLVSIATDLGEPYFCGSIHGCVYKYGFEFENLVGNALVTMYMKLGYIHDGYRVFYKMNELDEISWNALLSGFHDNESCNQGLEIFKQMLVEGFKPNMYTFVSVLRSCSSLPNVGFGKQVHAHIIKDSLHCNVFVGTALVDMYAKSLCLENAETIFNRLNDRDLFSWTVIISGYAQTDQGEKAVQCFSMMQKEGFKPNEFALASCLRACSAITSLENGRQLHSMAIKEGLFSDMFVGSALIDMYGKCGCIEDAELVFKEFDSHDTVTWNTIICGYSKHGQGEKALEAFETMLRKGAMPDEVTFIGVLSACSHVGFIEVGKDHFNSMSDVYGIIPSVDHYACMVDLLGRAGKFDELENFIDGMNLTPDALIWETILGACKMHGNLEYGKRAAEKLFELEPEIDSSYILLSNIFASKGRWDDVSNVRALMSNRGVRKEPGCSWVELDGQTHMFLSQDGSHPKTREIYEKLDDLGQKLYSVGYVPKTDNVLHNVADWEKRKNLLYHSERLALAFSLIGEKPHKTIRIFKNLRICEDCHDFIKLISDTTNREIVVRDRNRFHHFRSGTCSCHDYW